MLARDCDQHWGLPGAIYDHPCPYCEDSTPAGTCETRAPAWALQTWRWLWEDPPKFTERG